MITLFSTTGDNIHGWTKDMESEKSSELFLEPDRFSAALFDSEGTELNHIVIDSDSTHFLKPASMGTTSASPSAIVTKQYVDDSIASA